jgi:cytochrome c oxidase subunit 2
MAHSHPQASTPPRCRGDRGAGKGYVVAVIVWLVAATALTIALVGTNWWHQDAPLNTFNPKGSNARTIQDLVLPVFIVAGLVFVLVEGLILWLSIRRRKRVEDWEQDTDFPAQTHGNTTLELLWTGIPALVMAVIAVFTVSTLFELNDFDDTDMVVVVEGQQWWWQYKYDNNGDGVFGGEGDIVTANELVIPADTNVEMRITSNDVIHSYWIPELTGKKDAVPGLESRWKIEADGPGRYRGTCTEFCGLSHSRMQMYAIALSEDDYAAWVENELSPAVTLTEDDFDSQEDWDAYEAGRNLFQTQCTACHTIREADQTYGPPNGVAEVVSGTAPQLTHFMSRDFFAGAVLANYIGVQDTLDGDTPVTNYVTKDGMEPDINNLEQWLRDPESVKPMAPDEGRGMPNYGLSETQIDQLVAYLTTLK